VIKAENTPYCAGVVEDTTFGHNRYLAVADSISVPIVSVARSRLKEIEAHFVGRDAVNAVDLIMRDMGESITGAHAVVLGYGMIGKNVARSLSASDLRVSVYDIRDHRNLKAFMMGFRVNKKAELIRSADIVFAATGWSSFPDENKRRPALSADEILDQLSDNAVLVSVGSKDNEFDIQRLDELAAQKEQVHERVVRYTLPNKNVVHVIKDGTAVNFILPSIPVEILDLVFSEIVLAAIFLLKTPETFTLNHVNSVNERYLSHIAKDWLRFVAKGR
jgi:adenosylhomocysteinase